jgi:hypothetical protein
MEGSHYRNRDGTNYLPPGRIYGDHYRNRDGTNYLPPGRIYGVAAGEFHPGQTKTFTIAFRNPGSATVIYSGMFLCLVDSGSEAAAWSSGMDGAIVTLGPGGQASLSGTMLLPAAGTYTVLLIGTKTIGGAAMFEVTWGQPVTVN